MKNFIQLFHLIFRQQFVTIPYNHPVVVTHRNDNRVLNILVADQLHIAVFIIMDLDFQHPHHLSRSLRHAELPLWPTATIPARSRSQTQCSEEWANTPFMTTQNFPTYHVMQLSRVTKYRCLLKAISVYIFFLKMDIWIYMEIWI